MALQSVLQEALSRRRAAQDPRARMVTAADVRERVARDRFLGEREDQRQRGPQPFSLVGKDFFNAVDRVRDEAAWEGKDFNLGGMQGGRSVDVFSPLRQRMKTIEERQAESNDSIERANLSRRRDDLTVEGIKSARLGNEAAAARNREFDLHVDPAHQREHTAIDVERGETMGAHGRSEADLGFQQKLRQYFDPAHQGMLDNISRRETEPKLESERIRGSFALAGDEATARGRVAEAQVDASGRPQPAERLLENNEFVTTAIAALSKDPSLLTESDRAALSLLQRAMTRGGGAPDADVDPSRIVSREELEQYARENRKDPAAAARELQAQGYVIR